MEVEGKRLDDDIVSELCQPCQKGNVSTQADGYCDDCEEYMCQSCVQSHLKMKLGNNHTFGTVADGRRRCAQSKEEKCKKHTRETIKYYCRDHDSVGCGDCIVALHKKCDTEFIRDLAKNIEESSEFKNILKVMDDLKSLKADIEVSLGKNRNDNAEFHDKAIQEIQKSRAEIITWLDKVTTTIEAEEMYIWNENEKVLSKLEDWIKQINDMIDKVRDEINTEKYTGENLFIRMIECKSDISEFATNSVPEIKSNLNIKPFEFETNKQLYVFTKSANLGIIRSGNGTTELQIDQRERQHKEACIDGASSVESINLTGSKAKDVESVTLKRSEDSVRAELEKELERITETTILEKEQRANLEKACITVEKELEDQVILLSREREERQKCINKTNELEKTIVLLKQENTVLYDLNKRIKSKFKARQEQDQTKIQSLQSKLKKISERYEKEQESLSSQIRDLQRQRDSAKKTYPFQDPRAAGFAVGKRVEYTGPNLSMLMQKDRTGTVTAVDPSGNIDVKWDNGRSERCRAGILGKWHLKLL